MLPVSVISLLFVTSHVKCIDEASLEHLKTTLSDFTENGLFVSKFQEHLEKKGIFNELPFDGKEIANELASSMSAKLIKRSGLVKKVIQIIVDRHAGYQSKTKSKECCMVDPEETAYDAMFRAKVYSKDFCLSKSQYSNDTALKHLDSAVLSQWKLNLEDTPEAKWQFFGSVDGVSYVFPGISFPDCDNFDPRLRPWFAAALSFKKVIVVVLDIATNMAGCKLHGIDCLSVAKDLIVMLFNTLSSSDFIGLVTFDEEFYTPDKLNDDQCIQTRLAEASKANQDAFLEYLDTIRIKKGVESYYSAGFSGAELYLKDKTAKNALTTVVFLTATSNAESILTTNAAVGQAVAETGAVLIVYSLGAASSPQKADLTQMINTAGKGTFIEIRKKEDIYRKIGLYYKATVKKGESKPVLSQPYYDSFGLGTVTTVCQAVFSKDTGDFIGVAAVDIPISDLFSEAIEFQRSNGYAFVINIHGHTLSHPLLPKPSGLGAKFVDPKIDLLEADDTLNKEVFEKMKAHQDGDVYLRTPAILSKGFKREGIDVQYKNMSYNFRKVEGTMFSICVVSEAENAITSFGMTELPKKLSFTYHDIALQKVDPEFCAWFSHKSLEDSAIIKFAPKAFSNPFSYLDHQETRDSVQRMQIAMGGATSATSKLFATDVQTIVHLTSMLARLWENSKDITYPSWRYLGTERGVYRMFPGIKLSKSFDPTTRAWYQRALNSPDKVTVSAPYLDSLGTGYVVTVTKVVKEGKHAKPFGVMGMDIPVHYFYVKMLKSAVGCKGNYLCFLIDSAGFVILHPDWFGEEWEGEPQYENMHITQMEWDMAADMMKREYMKKKLCVDLYNTDEQHFYEMVVDQASHLKSNPSYEYKVVPDTNLYLVRKDASRQGFMDQQSVCKCEDGKCTSTRLTECECPCIGTLAISVCTGMMNREDYYSCYPQETAAIDLQGGEEDLDKLKPCFQRDCAAAGTEEACTELASCTWCRWNEAGKPLGNPYCAQTLECFYGKVGHGSPYHSQQIGRGAQTLCTVSTVVVIVSMTSLLVALRL